MRLLICLLLFVVVSLTVGKEAIRKYDEPIEICQKNLRYLDSVEDEKRELLLADSRNSSPYYWWDWTEKIVFNKETTVTVKQAISKNNTIVCHTEYTLVPGFKGPQSVKILLEPERAGKLLKSPTNYDLVRAVVINNKDTRTPEMLEQLRLKVKEMEPIEICEFQLDMIMEALLHENFASQLSMISVVVGPLRFAKYLDPLLIFKEGKKDRDHFIDCFGSIKRSGEEYSFGMYLREDDESETGWMVIRADIQGEELEK